MRLDFGNSRRNDIKHIKNHCASTTAVKKARNERGSHDDTVGMIVILSNRHGYFELMIVMGMLKKQLGRALHRTRRTIGLLQTVQTFHFQEFLVNNDFPLFTCLGFKQRTLCLWTSS